METNYVQSIYTDNKKVGRPWSQLVTSVLRTSHTWSLSLVVLSLLTNLVGQMKTDGRKFVICQFTIGRAESFDQFADVITN